MRLPFIQPASPASLTYFLLPEDWTKAQVDFFEAFKAYDEAGSPQRIQVLKYLVLAHMLTESEIDPFDSQETKPYKSDREIAAMQGLVQAYQDRNVHEAEKILRSTFSKTLAVARPGCSPELLLLSDSQPRDHHG